MLFVPALFQAIALFSFIPSVDTPSLAHQEMAYDGTTAISVSRCGFSPSYEISVAHVGHSPSYELTASHFGSTPSQEISTIYSDPSLLFDDHICHVDPTVWNASGDADPSVFLPLLLGQRFFASFMSLVCLFASCLLGRGATLFVGLCALVFAGLQAMILAGLYGLIFIVGSALLFVGGLGIMINVTFELAFMFLAVVVFGGFCGCLFVAFTSYLLYTTFGPLGALLLAFYLGSYCVSSSSFFVDMCVFFYYSYHACINSGAVRSSLYFKLVSSTGAWFVKVSGDIHDVYHFFWRPFFFYGLCTLLFVYRFFISLFSNGLCFTIFFVCIRPFFFSPAPAFF